MKKISDFKSLWILLLIVLSLIYNSSTFAQFKVNKIKITSLLDFKEKAFNFYPTIHYNRVEGLYLGVGVEYLPTYMSQTTLFGEGGYGISNQQWRYRTGFYKDFFELNKLRLGAEAFYLTSSLDDWFIGSIENSLAALFFKEDFMDYFAKQGYMIYGDQILLDNQLQLRMEVSNYDYRSMDRETNWSIFGKGKNFRYNPPVAEDNETSLKFIVSFDGRDNFLFPMSGWMVDGIYEYTMNDSISRGMFLTIKRYQQTFRAQRLRLGAMLGTRNGRSAEQYSMDLGGLGTLPGFRDKEFRNGNRFLLFKFQYLFGGDLLRNIPLSFIPLYDALTLSLFMDAGWLYFDENTDHNLFNGFDKVDISQLKTDVGFSLSVSEEMFIVNIAKRTDRGADAWRVSCRLMYKF